MNAYAKFENVDQMLKEAESTLSKGVGSLSEWSEQARELLRNKPNALLGAAGLSGFLTGALLRQGVSRRRGRAAPTRATLDPLITLVAGFAAGIIVGPLLIEKAISGLERLSQDEELNQDRGPMNQKPFEKV